MKKLSIVFLVLFLVSSVYAIGNPSAKFCIEQGNEYLTLKDEQGNEKGYCNVSGELVGGWEYFRNNQPKETRKAMSVMGGGRTRSE